MTQLITVPLSQLRLSHHNIRRTNGGNITELAASIRADGLLQNLTASRIPPDESEPLERFDVIAGGRRLRALQTLRDQGHLPDDYPVPVQIVSADIATEIGLAENTVRERMHPHDEFVAFRDLAAQGQGVESIAARFGVSPLVVERRLKLANVAPEILRAFREDRLTMDQIMAYAITDDWDAQCRHFGNATSSWDREPRRIREALTQREIPTSDKRVKFVGVDTYEKAGGAIRRDLFDDAGGGFLLDEALLDRCVEERLQREADALRAEGWSFVHIAREDAWKFENQCVHSTPKRREPTAEETAELKQLQQRLTAIQTALEDEGEEHPDADALSIEHDDIEERIDRIERGLTSWSDRQKAKAGALVSMSWNGSIAIERGLVPKENTKAVAKAASASTDPEAKGTPVPASLSESTIRRLTAHRTIALQSALMRSGLIALAALTHALLSSLRDQSDSPLHVSATTELGSPGQLGFEDVNENPHYTQVRADVDDLFATLRVPQRNNELWPWLVHQNRDTLVALLSAVSVLTINATTGTVGPHGADPIAATLDLDMADYWQPTAKTLFLVTPKQVGLEAVREVHGDAEASRIALMKKSTFAGECERLLARTRWLPKPLRRPGYKTPVPAAGAGAAASIPDQAAPKLKPVKAKSEASKKPVAGAGKPHALKSTQKKKAATKRTGKTAKS